jgi:putative ABC transport system substrate-binding protein
MIRRPIIILVVILAPLQSVLAQGSKVPLMGYLSSLPRAAENVRIESFRRGLRERGYSEGENLRIEYRWAEGKFDRLPGLAAELVRLKPDIILTGGPTATRPAKEATLTIPIVMSFDSDPVGSGFVASLASPGGNITGLSTVSPEIAAKQLDLLRDVNPKLSRVMVLGTSTNPGNAQAVEQTNAAARVLGIQLHYLDLLKISDVDAAYATAAKIRSDAVLMLSSPVTISNRKHVTSAAAKERMPTIYARPEFVQDGGLMTYSASINALFHRAATYVDKILKGAKPADLPVEQPTKFELIVNMKTAKELGITVPPHVLARADRVIK